MLAALHAIWWKDLGFSFQLSSKEMSQHFRLILREVCRLVMPMVEFNGFQFDVFSDYSFFQIVLGPCVSAECIGICIVLEDMWNMCWRLEESLGGVGGLGGFGILRAT